MAFSDTVGTSTAVTDPATVACPYCQTSDRISLKVRARLTDGCFMAGQQPELCERSPLQEVWLSYAEMASLTALGTANRRLRQKQGRSAWHHSLGLRAMDTALWHTVLPPTDDVDGLLTGALGLFDRTATPCRGEWANCVRVAVYKYLRQLLTRRVPHNRDELARELIAAGLWDEDPPQPRPI
jgi:hypothetical protein